MKLPLMSAAFLASVLFAAPSFAEAPAAAPAAPAAAAPAPDAGTMAPKKATTHKSKKKSTVKKASAPAEAPKK